MLWRWTGSIYLQGVNDMRIYSEKQRTDIILLSRDKYTQQLCHYSYKFYPILTYY